MRTRDNLKGWLTFAALIALLGLVGYLEHLDHARGLL